MIFKVTCYQTEDGEIHKTRNDALNHEKELEKRRLDHIKWEKAVKERQDMVANLKIEFTNLKRKFDTLSKAQKELKQVIYKRQLAYTKYGTTKKLNSLKLKLVEKQNNTEELNNIIILIKDIKREATRLCWRLK